MFRVLLAMYMYAIIYTLILTGEDCTDTPLPPEAKLGSKGGYTYFLAHMLIMVHMCLHKQYGTLPRITLAYDNMCNLDSLYKSVNTAITAGTTPRQSMGEH